MSHVSIPAKVRTARGLPNDLVRISVGIEDPHDLLQGAINAVLLGGEQQLCYWQVPMTSSIGSVDQW